MKRLVLGIFALTAVTQAFALQGGAHLGINFAGGSATVLNVDQTVDTKAGVMGGAFVELGLGPMFSLQPELNYVTKGESLTYLCIPILAKVKFHTGFVNPYVVAGPDIGFKMSSPTGSTVKGTDFALDFGGGAEFPINKMTSIVADLRYTMGLSNILDTDSSIASLKTKGFQVMGGVAFGF